MWSRFRANGPKSVPAAEAAITILKTLKEHASSFYRDTGKFVTLMRPSVDLERLSVTTV
ncbi:hypothetical protein [Gimesia chilikensis]|uniref:hypothetical protein n=1 Tax=Gimesia chilikensis TaxID=2605989 RepID=UPI0018D76470|nr:hypothetical protein [Gimesia chilikensis]